MWSVNKESDREDYYKIDERFGTMSDFLAECLVFGGYGCYGHSRDNARTPM